VEAFTQEWTTQPYGTYHTTVNSVTGGVLNLTATDVDPMIHMENIGSFAADDYQYIQIRYRVISGTASQVEIYYSKTGGGDLSENQVVRADLISDNNWHIVNVPMASSANWSDNITGWRYDYCTGHPVTLELDFITLANRPILDEGTAINVSPTSNTTYYTRKKGACLSTACISQLVTVNPDGTWIGGGSGNWEIGSNWCGGVPTSADDVVIPPGSTVHITADASSPSECDNIAVNGELIIDAGKAMTIYGELSNAGTTTIESSSTTNSGSLIVGSASGNHITYNRQMRADDWHYISSPVAGQSIANFLANNSDASIIWAWEELTGTWPQVTSGNFIYGQGYNLEQTEDDGKFSFVGSIAGSSSIGATSPYSDCKTLGCRKRIWRWWMEYVRKSIHLCTKYRCNRRIH